MKLPNCLMSTRLLACQRCLLSDNFETLYISVNFTIQVVHQPGILFIGVKPNQASADDTALPKLHLAKLRTTVQTGPCIPDHRRFPDEYTFDQHE